MVDTRYHKANIFLGLTEYELNSLLGASHLVDYISVHIQFDLERYLLIIKHAVAHFASFLAPFLLVLTILCFQDIKISATVAQLLGDVIKYAVAHFAPFLAPFLLVLTILCSQDTKIC